MLSARAPRAGGPYPPVVTSPLPGQPAVPPSPGGGVAAITLKTLGRLAAAGTPFACLTCYDATMARLLERAGVHVLLVGDTAAEVVLGFGRTIDMPLDVAVALTAAVRRGASRPLVMADMPFMSYQIDEGSALRNAGRFMTEGRADVVKIEADATFAPLVRAMTRAGVPICAHVGSRPQLAALKGGYGSAGRTPRELEMIVADAVALEAAGAVLLLIEAVPDAVTEAVMSATTVPLIGIGAGPSPHGQVLVIHDLLGLTDAPPPFATPLAQVGATIVETAREWVRRVGSRASRERGLGVSEAAAPGPMRPNSPTTKDIQRASAAHSRTNRLSDPPHAPADARR